jgi:hypothetical protein
VTVEGGPHNIAWTHPDEVNKALLELGRRRNQLAPPPASSHSPYAEADGEDRAADVVCGTTSRTVVKPSTSPVICCNS